VTAKISLGPRSCREHLRHLSVVFAVELRLKIVTELYGRTMSPTQFNREFGGGSVSRVARNFEILEEHGWLRYIRSAPGKGGRGVEKFYRAPDLAFIDAESWALVPYSMRVTSSWKVFNQIAPRLREAMEDSHRGVRASCDLVSTSLVLDEAGWKHVIDAVTSQFVFLFEEQKDAQLRVQHSGEDLVRADVFLIAFEASRGGDEAQSNLVESCREPLVPFHERLSPVFADDMCMQIVEELNRREMSVTQFFRQFGGGGGVSGVHRRFKRLQEIGWIAKVREETGGTRRGATEVYYRATVPAIAENAPWANVPDFLSTSDNWKTFEKLSKQVKASMKAGTFDRRSDRCLAWSLLSLDRQGWETVVGELDALHERVLGEQDLAKYRVAKSGEKTIKMTVTQAAFESPKEVIKAP